MSGGHALHAAGVTGDLSSPIHRLDPRAKLIGLVGVTVVAVSTPLSAWPVYAVCALMLGAIAAAARVTPRTLWTRARIVLPLVLCVAVFIPFVQGTDVFLTVSAKALLGTLSAVLLGATTSFPDVLHALERMKAPRLLVLIAALMYRYLFVIVDEVSRMRAALASRGYAPRHALQAQAIGRVATALFLRTYERAEHVHLAMLARGWNQAMPRLDVLSFRRADGLFVSGVLGSLLTVRVLAA